MNGRVYDPLTAMFFSPDPFVQAPGNWLNYNRYGYCMNNPTRYTDPSGYKFYNKESVWFAPNASDLMGYSSGGGGSGFFETTAAWNAQGSISYNYDNQSYQYASGNKATEQEAMDMYARPSNSYTYYGRDASTVFTSLRDGDSYTTNALNNIGISNQDALNALPNSLGIMVSLSQEFANANPGTFAVSKMNGTELLMNSDQFIVGLEVTSRYTLYFGIFVEGVSALSGNKDSKQNFWSDTMVSISLFTISAAGCGVPALILTVGWVMYRTGAFDGIFKQQYYQNNYTPNNYTPQDAIPQYPLKDGLQPIYFHH